MWKISVIFVLEILGESAEAQGKMVDTDEQVDFSFPSQKLNLVDEGLQQVLARYGCMFDGQVPEEIAHD